MKLRQCDRCKTTVPESDLLSRDWSSVSMVSNIGHITNHRDLCRNCVRAHERFMRGEETAAVR